MARKIVITSGKGGVGKSTICSNLGVSLALMGKRVVLIDADMGLNNLDVLMNMESRVTYDIFDVVSSKCRLKQALIQSYKYPTLYVLPSKQVFSKVRIDGFALKKIVNELNSLFDYVLIDCPAGIENGFHRAVFCADEVLIVTTPHLSAIRDADKVISVLSGYNFERKGLVVNRVRGDLIQSGKHIDITNIERLLKVKLVGVVPDNDEYSLKILEEKVDNPFYLLASNVVNNENKIFDYLSKKGSIFLSIKRFFGGR
ncbi:MAG: septum site-determining protein MinD [Clostridia bacterium]|nr:septum site-determining protein MinD [Clostridia bacterium]